MNEKTAIVKQKLNPHRDTSKEWFLDLLDAENQRAYEEEHLKWVLQMLKLFYIAPHQNRINSTKNEIKELREKEDYEAIDYRTILEKKAYITQETGKLNAYQCYFSEPYFARMDVVDGEEGYNSYYIGKKGDVNLEIVDWRAPLAVRYYQKSRVDFAINEYVYHTVLRRALSVKNGKVLDFKNEYLSVKDYLTPEEIGGRDEEILFDPFLRQILGSRKDDNSIRDIIETIQEKQFEIITRPERESFVLQGCAGSGKTMILLHRLSYLMYNNEKLQPRNVLVITPSDSFNAFIDELSQVLELQKVKTITLGNYFLQVLKNENIELGERMNAEKEPVEYLEWIYSSKFILDVKKQLQKMFTDVYGFFKSEECKDVFEAILADCRVKTERYERIKNASSRIRRVVLGEIKERADGGAYYTKPMRGVMSGLGLIQEFFEYLNSGKEIVHDDFFRRFIEFYEGAHEVSKKLTPTLNEAKGDLENLIVTIDKEIFDLKRYKLRVGDTQVYTYPERIAHREELKKEIEKTIGYLEEMTEGNDLFQDFFSVLVSSKYCVQAGKCKNSVDLARWYYRETIKKRKDKFGMKGIYPSDAYALCAVLSLTGRRLTPRYGLVFIDEGQDISAEEYALLRAIHSDASFNVFGDLEQNITAYRGLKDWSELTKENPFTAENDERTFEEYTLNRNYRNTNEIVDHVRTVCNVDMVPIGFHGESVERVPMSKINAFFRDVNGLKAVITREENIPLFKGKRATSILSEEGKLKKDKINVMTVYESKGLEFSAVAVYDKDMTAHEKYVAYTRALKRLAVLEEA